MPVDAGQTDPFSFYLTPSFSSDPVILTASGSPVTIVLPPVSSQSIAPENQTAYFTSLGTTEYVTSGQTYAYSEAQFPSLKDLPSPTVTSTTFPSQTISGISIWIQTGGFYWSPMPGSTPKPGDSPIPPLPSFPPVPTVECFTLFDIFSIDCPPNRHLPTTTFSSGAPSPTCTDPNSEGCGKLCTTNCDSSSSSSEKCTAQTATNYWVSCSSTTCQTTRTATFTGCSVTNTATTTGQYCPAGVTVDPNDDQGQDGPSPTSTAVFTTSIPEMVIIGGQIYVSLQQE